MEWLSIPTKTELTLYATEEIVSARGGNVGDVIMNI